MAGKRRSKGKPLVRVVRHERRAARLTADLAAAETAADRVSVAAAYLRGALVLYPNDTEAARIEDELIRAANRIYSRATGKR
jgi:hypothetical protein